MKYQKIQQTDPDVYGHILDEEKRQIEGLEMIPSENYASEAILEAVGSIMIDKYSEGYPTARYYQGNTHIDQVENIARDRAKKLFGVPHANVQPYSGSPANLGVYFALCKPGDVIVGHNLFAGGHLTHGWNVSFTGTYFESHQYGILPDGTLNYEEIEELVTKYHPVLLWCGATAYTRIFDYKRLGEIADKGGAYLVADISHVAGLIAAGVHASPVAYAHIITTSTHKTLRGPRGGMIMVTHKGLEKDPELGSKIDRSIFPGLQGGPHDNIVSGIAIALKEAATDEFRSYAAQIIANAKTLAADLQGYGFSLVGNGTENHMILIDLRNLHINGWYFAWGLEKANITVNRNTVAGETSSAFYPSGIRLGTPALTTRGLKEADMHKVAAFISQVKDIVQTYPYMSEKLTKDDKEQRMKFLEDIQNDKNLEKIRREVAAFAKGFPIPGITQR
jgi:glycine hydroxymethyltransferase